MTDADLLALALHAGAAMNAWDEIQKQSAGQSPLDSNNVVTTNNREAIRLYTYANKLKLVLLDAVKKYALERQTTE